MPCSTRTCAVRSHIVALASLRSLLSPKQQGLTGSVEATAQTDKDYSVTILTARKLS